MVNKQLPYCLLVVWSTCCIVEYVRDAVGWLTGGPIGGWCVAVVHNGQGLVRSAIALLRSVVLNKCWHAAIIYTDG
jgi:hypothetical protein